MYNNVKDKEGKTSVMSFTKRVFVMSIYPGKWKVQSVSLGRENNDVS